MGIKASPTCVLSYGDDGDGAVGYLIGEENAGMRYMFTMMNNARLSVGLEGLALAERAFQMALSYAKERKQGRAPGAPAGEQSAIVDHPDVRRMLLTQRASIEALRGIIYANAAAMDRSVRHEDEATRAGCAELADILTPVSKGWGTDLGVELTSLALQVFGGMGYIEETGVAQHYRDARIAPIYEGTNGIQAMDLVGRKLPMRGGAAVADYLGYIDATIEALDGEGDDLASIRDALAERPGEPADGHRLAARQRTGQPPGRAGRRHALPAPVQPGHRRLGDGAAGPQGPRGAGGRRRGGQGLLRGQGPHGPLLLRADPAAGARARPGRDRDEPRPGRRGALGGAAAAEVVDVALTLHDPLQPVVGVEGGEVTRRPLGR